MTWNKTGLFVSTCFFLITIYGGFQIASHGLDAGRLFGIMMAPFFGLACLWMAKE